jgi:hypothetical protein
MQMEFNLREENLQDLALNLQRRFSSPIVHRDRLSLFEEYVTWVEKGRKTTTIRYRRNALDFPVKSWLPVVATNPSLRNDGPQVGWVHLVRMVIKPFGDLNIADAYNDGFMSLEELKHALRTIYGEITEGELITIYSIEFRKLQAERKK